MRIPPTWLAEVLFMILLFYWEQRNSSKIDDNILLGNQTISLSSLKNMGCKKKIASRKPFHSWRSTQGKFKITKKHERWNTCHGIIYNIKKLRQIPKSEKVGPERWAARWLRALTPLAEALGFLPSAYTGLTVACDSSSRGSNPLFWPL